MAPDRRTILCVRGGMIPRLSGPLRFGVVGVINTLLGVAVIFTAKAVFGFGDISANVSGYTVGLMASFILNKRWTFRHDGPLLDALPRFAIAFGVAYSSNLLTVLGLRDIIGVDSYAAQAAGVVPYIVSFYLLSIFYVFPEEKLRRDA